VYRYDDLPLDDPSDRRNWPPLLHALYAFVAETIESGERLGPTI
jgi:hypothetical protein